jgi:hypothetical protein
VFEPLPRHQLFWCSRGISQSLQANPGTVLHIRPRPLPFTSPSIHYSSPDTIQCELLRRFLNKWQNLIYLHQYPITMPTQPPTSVFTPPQHNPVHLCALTQPSIARPFPRKLWDTQKGALYCFCLANKDKNAVVMFIAEIYRKRRGVVTLRNKKKHDNCLVRKIFL